MQPVSIANTSPALRIRRRQVNRADYRQLHTHPVIAKLYAQRHVSNQEEVCYALGALLRPDRLEGMAQAVGVLAQCVRQQEKIVVVGDYDADGATATALSVLALRHLGAKVDFVVPSRFKGGYGLSPPLVEEALAKGAQCLMTVDNGIVAFDGVSFAKQAGLKVVITDHHLPSNELGVPAADAIVNPNQLGDAFPSKYLAGVGVAFYVMSALRSALIEQDYFAQPPPSLAWLLDLVAVGTVADVVPLDRNNRILVDKGVSLLRQGRGRPGIQALLSQSKRELSSLQAHDLGFSVGPRLNAAGRMEDMTIGVNCLLAESLAEAEHYAQVLEQLNRQRREVEQSMRQEADELVKELLREERSLPDALVVFGQDWHSGIIGILSGRLKEAYHRPVVAFAPQDDGALAGSGRSIPGIHLRDALVSIEAKHPALVLRCGGHAMAAGVTIVAEGLSEFEALFQAEIAARSTQASKGPEWLTDGPLPARYLNRAMLEQLSLAGPWGQGFEPPSFDDEFAVLSARVVGERHLKLRVRPLSSSDSKQAFNAILFNQAERWQTHSAEQIRLVYQLTADDFRGRRDIQLLGLAFECIEPGVSLTPA